MTSGILFAVIVVPLPPETLLNCITIHICISSRRGTMCRTTEQGKSQTVVFLVFRPTRKRLHLVMFVLSLMGINLTSLRKLEVQRKKELKSGNT